MRRLLVHILLMTITFSFGLALDWLLPNRNVNNARPQKVDVVEVRSEPAVLPTTITQSHLVFDYDPLRFIPDGTYLINDWIPQEFREFNAFDVRRIEKEDHPIRYVGIQTYSNKVYTGQPVLFALVTEKRLFFLTSPNQEGLEYRFDGEFIQDPEYFAGTGATVLYGELTKSKDGKRIAQRRINFRLQRTGR